MATSTIRTRSITRGATSAPIPENDLPPSEGDRSKSAGKKTAKKNKKHNGKSEKVPDGRDHQNVPEKDAEEHGNTQASGSKITPVAEMGANQKIGVLAKSALGSSPAMSELTRPPTSEREDESIASPEVELERAHKKWEETQRSIPNARLASEYVMELLQQVIDEWRDRGQSVPADYNHGINPYEREAKCAERLAEALYETIDNVVWEEATTETEPEMTPERSEGFQGKIEDPHTSDEEPLDPRDGGDDYDRR
ncbi:hypothetical protein BJ138DRAFT_1107730, partial [Hygrophoropsis aurantiaca]